MGSQTQGIPATSPDTGIGLCDEAASSSLASRVAQEGSTVLDQSVAERKQLREILEQVQRAREHSSTELAQLRKQMNLLG
uniref:Uncharacterized protein n=1 Tax=Hyaloperonospora arabidopsidis (strain Emoy2) TaxID=559515 RepID=M4BG20_HYAAE